MLGVFELALRSMRQNVKIYYLYFFSLIFCMSLFFIFASLRHDQQVQDMMESSANFLAAFQSASVLLIVIIGIFSLSSNHIFLRRRSREIGLYQLIGLSKGWVARYLMIEHVLLGIGALLAGIICGALASRIFVLILMYLLDLDAVPDLSFSVSSAIETVMVFILIVAIASVQVLRMIYGSTLLHLFQADRQPELSSRRPTIFTAIVAVLGVLLIGYGYELSGRMVDKQLLNNALLVLGSTITGTYLLFRVTIRWCFFWLRKRKEGHLGLYHSLSLAPLMHRMKANANSLTLITVLSALTITLITMAYSFHYSAQQDTRMAMPYDFTFENKPQDAQSFTADLDRQDIVFDHYTIRAIRTTGVILHPLDASSYREGSLLWLSAEQLRNTGAKRTVPADGEVIAYSAWAANEYDDIDYSKRYPTMIELQTGNQTDRYPLNELITENLVNFNILGNQMLVSEATLNQIEKRMIHTDKFESVQIDVYRMLDQEGLAAAASMYEEYRKDDHFMNDFYTEYKKGRQATGLFMFIAAFLGLAFLASTGSILYFKQMTEAEQERQSFKTLRQLGFEVGMIMKGILRKQIVVFMLPLAIGVMHALFAVRAASFMILSDITIPTIVSIIVYMTIYFMFALFTLGYYRKVVKSALL